MYKCVVFVAGCVNVIFGDWYHHLWHCGTLGVQMLPSDKVAVLSVCVSSALRKSRS